MKIVIQGNKPFLSAREIHSHLLNETSYEVWLRYVDNDLKPIHGIESIEYGENRERFFSPMLGGYFLREAIRADNSRKIGIRMALGQALEEAYTLMPGVFTPQGQRIKGRKNQSFESKMQSILLWIQQKGEVSKTDLCKRFGYINKKQRESIMDQLVSDESIEMISHRAEGARKSTVYYVFRQ